MCFASLPQHTHLPSICSCSKGIQREPTPVFSLTSSSHERQLEDRLIYANYLTQWFEERKLTERYAHFLNHLKFMSKIKMLRTSPRQFKRWKNTFPESNKYIMTYQDIPLKYRILFYLADKLILK